MVVRLREEDAMIDQYYIPVATSLEIDCIHDENRHYG